MTSKTGSTHVVVDGSNIATEGRSMPSLAQLNEAVMAFLEERPGTTVTVVVDATFGHRIAKSETKEFDAAVANNELVAPPAGAVGRGDAFVLGIADKAGATILSNDSFQEFHGDYEWLFDDGRLVGGKPVPHVGWVFVPRVPVRGPVSRKAVRESKRPAKRTSASSTARSSGSSGSSGSSDSGRSRRTSSRDASQPMPVPKTPPPGRVARAAPAERTRDAAASSDDASQRTGEAVNELMPFLEFVEHHPVGTSVNAIVESYSSHGAYVTIGDVRGYVPLRLMADPAPRSARQVMKVGDAVTLVVVSFAPARRSIDCAVPHMAIDVAPQDPSEVIHEAEVAEATAAESDTAAAPTPAAKRAAKQAAAKQAPAKKAAATTSATKKAPAKKAAAKKAPAKKAAATKTATKKAAAATASGKQTASSTAARAKKAPTASASASTRTSSAAPGFSAADVAPVNVPAAENVGGRAAAGAAAPSKKSAARKAAAKKAPAKRAAANTAPTKKAAATKAPARKAPAKKAAAKKAPAKKAGAGASRRSRADAS